ncbi:unnamed protein product [Clavelina lepadiformis]|uniref:Senescence domain-containing protein n=1 Tax=Clavelina lepadiformis TaxID=159417 RepID=A0ABP0F6B6_CLALP
MSTAHLSCTLLEIEEYYQTSLCYVSSGLAADENGDIQLAVQHYVDAMQSLEKGISVELVNLCDKKHLSAQDMQAKMISALKDVQTRLYELQETTQNDPVPEYSAVIPKGHSGEPMQAKSINACEAPTNNLVAEDAVELLHIPGGIQLFSVSEDLNVNVPPPSYPTSLSVFIFENDLEEPSTQPALPPAFIQAGDWIYPLVRGHSPVLLCANGAYMFQNIIDPSLPTTDHPDYIGLVISSALDPAYGEMFTNILSNMACLQVQEQSSEEGPPKYLCNFVNYQAKEEPVTNKDEAISQKIASGIEKSAGWLSWGLVKGAKYTSSLIKLGADHLQKNITPDEKPTTVNPTLNKGLQYTHEASKSTVKVSAEIVKGLTTLTTGATKTVFSHVKPYANFLFPKSNSSEQEAKNSNMKGVMTVVGAGVTGFSEVWTSLEKAGMAIAHSVSQATVDTVQHKYGAEAGKSTSHIMGTAVNVGRTAFNLDNLGIKAMVKRTAKNAGKTALMNYVGNKERLKESDGVQADVGGETSSSEVYLPPKPM